MRKPSISRKRKFASALCLLACIALNDWARGWILTIFVIPSGHLAAWLAGAYPAPSAEGVSFLFDGTVFEVTHACSGVVFFGLLLALAVLSAQSPGRILVGLPLIYLFAIASNALRITFWAAGFPVLNFILPSGFLDAGHEIAGAIVYLPAALGAHWVFKHLLGSPRSATPSGSRPIETQPTANS